MFIFEILITTLLFGGYYLGASNILFSMSCFTLYMIMVACRYYFHWEKEKEYKRRIEKIKKYRKEAEVAEP